SHLIAPDQPFLLPVVIDETLPETDERIPDQFREVQWTPLPNGETPPEFVEWVRRLLSPAAATTIRAPASAPPPDPMGSPDHSAPHPSEASHEVEGHASATQQVTSEPRDSFWAGIRHGREYSILIALLVLAGSVLWYVSRHERSAASAPANASHFTTSQAAFNPPPHSIAVLPFLNLSGGPEQDYFSDGLTEELLNSLAAINELQVAARTSAFSFKDKQIDLGVIAPKLNVRPTPQRTLPPSAPPIPLTA